MLGQERERALRSAGRVEFGGGILEKLVYAFCDSGCIGASDYAATLCALQELFYGFKNLCGKLSDDELILAMKLIFESCGGSLERLSDADADDLYAAGTSGSLDKTQFGEEALYDPEYD